MAYCRMFGFPNVFWCTFDKKIACLNYDDNDPFLFFVRHNSPDECEVYSEEILNMISHVRFFCIIGMLQLTFVFRATLQLDQKARIEHR